jgi:hypothetical protein
MLSRDTVEFAHVALGLAPKILDTSDVISAFCKELRMIDTEVLSHTSASSDCNVNSSQPRTAPLAT